MAHYREGMVRPCSLNRDQGDSTDIRIIDNFSIDTCNDLTAVVDFQETPADTVTPPPSSDGVTVELVVDDILNKSVAPSVTKGFGVVVYLAANTDAIPSVTDSHMDCMT